MRLRRSIASTALAVMMFTGVAVPAHATVHSKGSFAFQQSLDEDLCGIAARIVSVGDGRFRNRTGKGELDQAFLGSPASSSPTPSPTSPPARRRAPAGPH